MSAFDPKRTFDSIRFPPKDPPSNLHWPSAFYVDNRGSGAMFSLIFRGFLIAVGFVASWFVAKDAPQFGVMQMAVALILFVFIVVVLAFWPERLSHILDRVHKPPPSSL